MPFGEAVARIEALGTTRDATAASQQDILRWATRNARQPDEQRRFELRLVIAIARNNWSFRCLENKETQQLLTEGRRVQIPSRNVLMRLMRILHAMVARDNYCLFGDDQPFTLSLDGWTGRAGLKMIGVVRISIREEPDAQGIFRVRYLNACVSCG